MSEWDSATDSTSRPRSFPTPACSGSNSRGRSRPTRILLLVDEPFAGLSTGEVESVSDLLANLREEGLTLVVVDHNMRGLLSLIDRAVVIRFGAKLAEGTPDEIRTNEEVQEAYLGGST